MVNLVYYLKNLFFFDIPLLHYYMNLRSSIVFCLFSVDIYLLYAFLYLVQYFRLHLEVSEWFCGEVFKTFVILYVSLLPIKWLIASGDFLISLSEALLNVSVAECLAWLISFWMYLPLTSLLIFLPIF